jgi:hypothetical protein
MSQSNRVQLFDATSAAGGNLSFPPSGFYPTDQLTALLVAVVITGNAPASVVVNTKRTDGTAVVAVTATTPATGTHWEFSLTDYLATNPLTSTAVPPVLPPFAQVVVTGATSSVVRMTVWAVKLQG